jgi:hypothetical protein
LHCEYAFQTALPYHNHNRPLHLTKVGKPDF